MSVVHAKFVKMLVEDFHSTTVATIAGDGYPQTRVIDMMLWDAFGIYFLTAKGKEFYRQLMEQQFVAVSATKEQKAVSLRGKIKNIGSEKLAEIFEVNPYMKAIYPEGTRDVLEVFCIYEAQGEYFDISNPSHVVRESFSIGDIVSKEAGYFVERGCIGCEMCLPVCPQACIKMDKQVAVIDQNRCLHCGACFAICPEQAIVRR